MKLDKTISNTILKQKKEGEEVKKNDIILGDCIYFDNKEGIKYIGLYIGNNKMIYPSSINGKRIIIEEDITKLNTENINIRRFLPQYEIGDFLLHTRTPFKYCEKISKFILGDHDGNGIMDLFCIKNEKDITEIHVLNGENNFKSFYYKLKVFYINLIMNLNLNLGIVKK